MLCCPRREPEGGGAQAGEDAKQPQGQALRKARAYSSHRARPGSRFQAPLSNPGRGGNTSGGHSHGVADRSDLRHDHRNTHISTGFHQWPGLPRMSSHPASICDPETNAATGSCTLIPGNSCDRLSYTSPHRSRLDTRLTPSSTYGSSPQQSGQLPGYTLQFCY